MKGQCLCKAVQFNIEADSIGIYQCHCSECRKITGSASNSSCIVPASQFYWVQGESNISSYHHIFMSQVTDQIFAQPVVHRLRISLRAKHISGFLQVHWRVQIMQKSKLICALIQKLIGKQHL